MNKYYLIKKNLRYLIILIFIIIINLFIDKRIKFIINFITVSIILIGLNLVVNEKERFELKDDNSCPFNIYYINLDSRKDRNEHLLSEIKKLNFSNKNIIRVPAIYNKIGAIGCSQSHIKALKMALEDDNNFATLILEDDFTFRSNSDDPALIIKKILKSDIEWNVILFAINGYSSSTQYDFINKVDDSQTTSGYLIKKEYIPTLLSLWEEVNNKVKDKEVPLMHEEHCDISWKKLQNDNWYVTKPVLGFQYPSYSNIAKVPVAYNV